MKKKFKKLLVASLLVVMSNAPVWAIDLTAIGTYLWEASDAHMIDIQGEMYALDKRENAEWLYIKSGSQVIMKFSLDENDHLYSIKIIDAEWNKKIRRYNEHKR